MVQVAPLEAVISISGRVVDIFFQKKSTSMESTIKVVARMHSNQFFCREFKCHLTDVLPVPSTGVRSMIRKEMEAHIVSQKFSCTTCQSLMLGLRPMSLAPSRASDDCSYIMIEECVDIFCIPCRYKAAAKQLAVVAPDVAAQCAIEHMAAQQRVAQSVIERMATEQRVAAQSVIERMAAEQRVAAQSVTERMAAEQRATQSV